MKKLAGYLCLLVIMPLLGGALYLHEYRTRAWLSRANLFYESALKDARTHERVQVRGVTYDVAGGDVSGDKATVPERDLFEARRIAYALTLARRSPFWGLPGTDPASLRISVRDLIRAQEQIPSEQSSHEQALLRDLYPTHFLFMLAALEESRLRFLDKGDLPSLFAYERALRKTLAAGQQDANSFRAAQDKVLGDTARRIASLGGVVSHAEAKEAARHIVERLEGADSLLEKREACVRGRIEECEPSDLMLDFEPVLAPTTAMNISRPREIWSLFEEAFLDTEVADSVSQIRVLVSSACAGATEGPYFFGVREGFSKPPRVRFLNELLFLGTSANNDPVPRHLRDEYHIDFAPTNVFMFYTCPDIIRDSGRLFAMRRIQEFALQHKDIASILRTPLVEGMVLTEWDAGAYLSAALQESHDPALLHELESLTLMLSRSTTWFDSLITNISRVMRSNALQVQAGVGYDMSAQTLFVSHSAFPSLFLGHILPNSAVILSRDFSANDLNAYRSRFIPYENVISKIPRARLIEHIRSYFTFEQKYTTEL